MRIEGRVEGGYYLVTHDGAVVKKIPLDQRVNG